MNKIKKKSALFYTMLLCTPLTHSMYYTDPIYAPNPEERSLIDCAYHSFLHDHTDTMQRYLTSPSLFNTYEGHSKSIAPIGNILQNCPLKCATPDHHLLLTACKHKLAVKNAVESVIQLMLPLGTQPQEYFLHMDVPMIIAHARLYQKKSPELQKAVAELEKIVNTRS